MAIATLPNIDRVKLIGGLLRIVDKGGNVVPFVFNRMQAYFHRNKSNRNIILKHRQGGMSSSILADEYIEGITVPNTSCAVVSHEGRATQRLLDRVHFYHDSMDEPKPELGGNSRNEITFPDMHSSIYIGTAGARAFGRGDTIRKALLSELAYYEDGERILIAVEDAVPMAGELDIECYDDQTEILTDRGWLLFKDVELEDKVLSKNVDTNIAYWSGIDRKIERPATELIKVAGKCIDFAVTPNHNIWARRSRTVQPFKVIQAKELFEYSEWEFDSSMTWVGERQDYFEFEGVSIPMNLWLEFMGFFLSEGYCNSSYVEIYQDGIYQEEMRACCERVAVYFGKELKVYKNGRDFKIHDVRLANYLSSYTQPKKIPREIIDLDKEQLHILFTSYMKGDGEKARNRCVTKDIPLRDDLQEMGLKIGFRSNFMVRKARIDSKGINHRESYVISFYKSNRPSARHSRGQIKRVSYDGMVYCVYIPRDHMLMVRRNGKVIWHHNCTPNGEDNIFYDRWIKAREGKSPYKPFFFPWWWSEDYRISLGSEYALEEDKGVLNFTSDELELVEKHSLTEDQIRWRRWKIAEKGGLFWQEFPEDEMSCFITIGDPVFDQSILNNLATSCYEGERHPGGWTFWIPPDPTGKTNYVIGADTSAGAPTGSYSAAVVLDDNWRICATFQARLEPATFARILKEMGTWYNRAQIAMERNFTGYAVLASLVGGHNVEDPGIQLSNYPNIYRQRDFLTGKVTSNLGWWTNDQTKGHMKLVLAERLPQLKLWDINLVRQIRSYRFIKMRATAQTFDDMAIALMIACAVKKVEGGSRGYQGRVPGYSW